MTKTLYTKDAKGKLRYWRIDAATHGFNMTHGTMGGAGSKKFVPVAPKAQRTLLEQIHSEMNSRINKQRDKGYVDTLEEAETVPKTNALGLIKPMLATPIDKVKNADYKNAYIQRKYNGHRCLIHNDGNTIQAYSRNGKPIETIDHIVNFMDIEENATLDGELYVHGEYLQSISSLVKKVQENNRLLNFVAYDTVLDAPYHDRLAELRSMRESPSWGVAPTLPFIEGEEEEYMKHFVKEGYEGAIIRLDGYSYEDSKRSKGLIKVKPKYDDEFMVVDMEQSRDGWAILVCAVPWDTPSGADIVTFKVSAPGTMEEKHQVWREREFYIGRYINVEYYELTKAKIPFHPVAAYWRNKGSE